jgi:hypothetical protein
MNRRRFILSAAGAGITAAGLSVPAGAHAATDDELAYASFGQAGELLLQDFYTKAAAAKVVPGSAARELARGALNAAEHADAQAKLLLDAGQTAAVAEDFEFAWPDGTFESARSMSGPGREVTQALLGVYLSAAGTISIASYRTLFASMAANTAQQLAVLSRLSGARAVGVSFPPAIDVETASDAIEAYLG